MRRDPHPRLDIDKFVNSFKDYKQELQIQGKLISEQTGVSEPTISRISSKNMMPDIGHFLILCRWMNIDPMTYIKDKDNG